VNAGSQFAGRTPSGPAGVRDDTTVARSQHAAGPQQPAASPQFDLVDNVMGS
jgi:hypothetical protein